MPFLRNAHVGGLDLQFLERLVAGSDIEAEAFLVDLNRGDVPFEDPVLDSPFGDTVSFGDDVTIDQSGRVRVLWLVGIWQVNFDGFNHEANISRAHFRLSPSYRLKMQITVITIPTYAAFGCFGLLSLFFG
jgi:hypothetical protein